MFLDDLRCAIEFLSLRMVGLYFYLNFIVAVVEAKTVCARPATQSGKTSRHLSTYSIAKIVKNAPPRTLIIHIVYYLYANSCVP